jgi:hypothetical protein
VRLYLSFGRFHKASDFIVDMLNISLQTLEPFKQRASAPFQLKIDNRGSLPDRCAKRRGTSESALEFSDRDQ